MADFVSAERHATFKGRHLLFIMLAFFGVIIAVNLTMAYFAVSSWTGLVAQNTYVASQEFNQKAKEARGWTATGIETRLDVDAKGVRYKVTHPKTGPVLGEDVVAIFRHPVGDKFDFTVTLEPQGNGVFYASHTVKAGQWIVDLETTREGQTVFREARRIFVK